MKQKRIEWVDYAKGISIILVVLHHAITRNPEGAFFNETLLYINDTLKFFRMPLFFFVSGLFLYKTLQRGLKDFLKTRILNLFYLFALWGLIRYLMEIIIPYFILANERTPEDFKLILYHFIDPYRNWFIYALLIFFLITRLTKRALIFTFAFSIIMLTVSVQNGNHHEPTFFDELSRYYPMFLLGYFTSDLIKRFANNVKWYHLLLTIPYLITSGYVLNSNLAGSPIVVFTLMYLGVMVGVIYSVNLSKINLFSWVNYVGQYTLPIYLLHGIPIIFFQKVFAKFLPPSLTYLVVLSLLIIGVIIPLIAYRIFNKVKMGWLFQFPLSTSTKKQSKTKYRTA